MRALSIRQPYAELMLRGVKTAELRSRPTAIVGERFYIYASRQWAVSSGRWAVGSGQGVWSRDLGAGAPPGWMVELAEQVRLIEPGALAALPRGVILRQAQDRQGGDRTRRPAGPGRRRRRAVPLATHRRR